MKENRIWHIVLMTFLLYVLAVPVAIAATAADLPAQQAAVADAKSETAYLQDIAFEKLPGKERIIFSFSKETGVMIESKNSHGIVAIMSNTYIPEDFRRAVGEGKLNNVTQVSASQQDKDGQPWGYVTMEMQERVPYMVRKDGTNIIIDFNVAGVSSGKLNGKQVASTATKTPSTIKDKTFDPLNKQKSDDKKADLSKLITIDFQEANIKSVLRLLAEEAGVSIASGDDVKGNVTLTLKKVSWMEAFETVLTVQGLGKVKEGEVYVVKTIDRMRKEERTKADEAIDRIKRQSAQDLADQEQRVKDGRLPQISIEAKIVEVSSSGSRDLGVFWGGAYKNNHVGVIGSNMAADTSNKGLTDTFSLTSSKWGDAGGAINLPGTQAIANPSLGVIVATSHFLLAAKLEALEKTGEGRIISSPRVTTLDNETAKIGQGEEIPYVTRDKDGTPNITMKDAKLELEVKPKITSEGKISMGIICNQKVAEWDKTNTLKENPPLVASNVDSKVVVSDGDTIVLGGIKRMATAKSQSGWPWLQKVPILGWLFKSTSNSTEERELIIFVTPRIVKGVSS